MLVDNAVGVQVRLHRADRRLPLRHRLPALQPLLQLDFLDRISPISLPFFLVFARLHRLAQTVPTSPKQKRLAEKQWQGVAVATVTSDSMVVMRSRYS